MADEIRCVWCLKTVVPEVSLGLDGRWHTMPPGWLVREYAEYDSGGAEFACSVACVESSALAVVLEEERLGLERAEYGKRPRNEEPRDSTRKAREAADREMAKRHGANWKAMAERPDRYADHGSKGK